MLEKSRYKFDFILLNGKPCNLSDILAGQIQAQSAFEETTVAFIRDWLSGTENFAVNTSGSTGTPKTIIRTRTQMAQSAWMTINALGLHEDDTALVCLNTQFIAGKMMLVRALEGQMKIVAVEPSANPLQNNVQPFDFAAFVPLQLQVILNTEKKNKLNYIRAILIGGAAVHQNLLKAIQVIQSPVYLTYGMTETISHIALQKLSGQSVESSFKTLPGIQIDVDKRGCLVIAAPYLEEKIITNDLVELHDKSTFTWIGRWDNIINTGGIKVSPEKIEHEIQQIMEPLNVHQHFIIAAIPDEILGEKIILIVEGKQDKNWGKILTLYKQSFSKYATPKEIFTLDKFIYTESEKVDRKATIRATMA